MVTGNPLMLENIRYQYISLGLLVGLLVFQWIWCQFVAYPISFERQLKKGKPWVYIPLQWKGGYKFQILLFSRALMVCLIAVGVLLLTHYTHKAGALWFAGYGIAIGLLVLRLNSFWMNWRYHQQEDSYYFLHDELRVKLESEGKDMADSAFKSLAAYQHQNLLRKADEQGHLIQVLRSQSKKSRKYRKDVSMRETVET